jgi:hypothetical protein
MDRATNTFKSTILDSISENTTRNVIELSKTKGNNAVMAGRKYHLIPFQLQMSENYLKNVHL